MLPTWRLWLLTVAFVLLPAVSPLGAQTSIPTGSPASYPPAGPLAHTQIRAAVEFDSFPRHPTVVAKRAVLPLAFEPNEGQADSGVRFTARGPGYTLLLTTRGAILRLATTKVGPEKSSLDLRAGDLDLRERRPPKTIRLEFLGASRAAHIAGERQLPGKSNYFIGNDPEKWRTNVRNYGMVRYHDLYPGIDLVYYGNEGRVEHDLIVAPGRDPGRIAFDVLGVDRLRVEQGGDLTMQTDEGDLKLLKPKIYQLIAGSRREVEGRYVLRGRSRVGFQIAQFDRREPLVMDPVLIYSTYLGGSSADQAQGVALDSLGNVYVTGFTASLDFPTTAHAVQPQYHGATDAFVTKLKPDGSAVLYSTYLGGSGPDLGAGIAVDNAGNAYVAGQTGSTDFPTALPFQSVNQGGSDAFVAKLSPDGSALLYSTYLGGAGEDTADAIAVDSAGNVYVTGATTSDNFPTALPFQSVNAGGSDAFVAKLSSNGSALVYATYLGGTAGDAGDGIAVDPSGNAYVVGGTASTDFPTLNPLQASNAGAGDAFVAKLNAAGSALEYSTYLGGTGADLGSAIVVDAAGNAYVTGNTASSDFPTLNAVQNTCGASTCRAAFVAKVNAGGSALGYSTYLGGIGPDRGTSIAVDSAGNAYVVGGTSSSNFPTVNPLQAANAGHQDAFVSVISPASGKLLFFPVTPCRVADTRNAQGTFGGPSISGNSTRDFPIPQSACNIPPDAAAYSLNVTVVPHQPLGFLSVWASGQNQPLVSTLNSFDGRTKANAAIVVAGSNGAVSVFASNTSDVVLDINGYFAAAAGLAFYTLPPCRVVDTRNAADPLGGPSLVANQSRTFPLPASDCIPPGAHAQAYSLNVTAVPHGPLFFLSAWPSEQTWPGSSTLNAPTGTAVANGAIVPAGPDGGIQALASNDTDMVVDINGYFAPPGAGGLSLYPTTACRVLDTRGQQPRDFQGELTVNVVGSSCGVPTAAQAFVLNATVVPPAPLGFLSLWPDGQSQPLVSTLNSFDGAVTSNMAIVPTSNGEIDAYASDLTPLILDISSYFAP